LCAGVQRIRCNPFKLKKDKVYGRNFSQYVAAGPPKKQTDIPLKHFYLANVMHRQKLWFGRVELFFRCSFMSSCGRVFDLDLASVSFLYDFKCPDAMTILPRKAGARMFYEPDQPWLIVLPINHIVGRVPLIKAYLEGSDSPTIPNSTHNSELIGPTRASVLQARTYKSCWLQQGHRKPIVYAKCAYVAVRAATTTYYIRRRASCKTGQDETSSWSKNESVGKTFCRTEVRIYALLCKLPHHDL
jgi:hypothetical protein